MLKSFRCLAFVILFLGLLLSAQEANILVPGYTEICQDVIQHKEWGVRQILNDAQVMQTRILLGQLDQEKRNRIKLAVKANFTNDNDHLIISLMFNNPLPGQMLNLSLIQDEQQLARLLAIGFAQAMQSSTQKNGAPLAHIEKLHQDMLQNLDTDIQVSKIMADVYEYLKPDSSTARNWLQRRMPMICEHEAQTELFSQQHQCPAQGTWKNLQPIFDASAMYFADTLSTSGKDVLSSLREWFPAEIKPGVVGCHPAFFFALQPVLRNSLDAPKKVGGVFSYLIWIKNRVTMDTYRREMILPFLLDTSFIHPTRYLPQGIFPTSPDSPEWQSHAGPEYWQTILRPALQAVVARYDGVATNDRQYQTSPSISEVAALTNLELWTKALVGKISPIQALRYFGQSRMVQEWQQYNQEALQRIQFVQQNGEQGIDKEDFAKLVSQAKATQNALRCSMQNPWCAAWLGLAARMYPASCLESGIFLQYLAYWQKAGALACVLQTEWTALLTLPKATTPPDKLATLPGFIFWETIRGRWWGQEMHDLPAPTEPFWETVEDDETLAAMHWKLLEPWIAQPTILPGEKERASLAAFCWLGLPRGAEKIIEALDIALHSDNLGAEDMAFLTSCRAQLIITSIVAQGVSLDAALQNRLLHGASNIGEIPSNVAMMYQDGRPFCVRSALDMAWVFGYRTMMKDNLGFLTTTEVQNTLAKLRDNEILNMAYSQARAGKTMDGLALAVKGLDNRISEMGFNSVQLQSFTSSWENVTFTPSLLGTSFWGTNYFVSQWQQEMDLLRESYLFSIQPIKDKAWQAAHLYNKLLRPYLGATLAFLRGEPCPPHVQMVFLRRQGQKPRATLEGSWQDLEYWFQYLQTEPKAKETMHVLSMPWIPAAQPEGMLEPLLERIATLDTTIGQMVHANEPVDIDGINQKYLPAHTWSQCDEDLKIQIAKLQDLEGKIRQHYSDMQLHQALREIQPLLAAPLVADMATFRKEMDAAIAEVREAESVLESKRHESLALEMECLAQDLLKRVYELEEERTAILLKIQEHEKQRAELDRQQIALQSQIEDQQIQINNSNAEKARLEFARASLNKTKAERDAEIAQITSRISQIRRQMAKREIEKQKGELKIQQYEQKKAILGQEIANKERKQREIEEEISQNDLAIAELEQKKQDNELNQSQIEEAKTKIQVRIAAQAVAALHNQLQLLQDLIVTPTPHPNQPGHFFSGKLGLLAYQAEQQVQKQIEAITQQQHELQRELDRIREKACIRNVCRFIGAVVGFILGGPPGALLGYAIGQAGGGLLANVIQNRPFSETLGDLTRDGIGILMMSNRNVAIQLSQLDRQLGYELSSSLREMEKLLSPAFKDFPSFISKAAIKQSFRNISAIQNEALKTVLASSQSILQYDVTDLKPEEIQEQLQNSLEQELPAYLSGKSLRFLQEAGQELGVPREQLSSSAACYQNIAQKVSLFVMVRSIESMQQERDQMLIRFMLELAQRQQVAATRQPWNQLKKEIRAKLEQAYPNHPEKQELMMGQFQMQLDTDGMQAQVQQMLSPWNQELQRRMQNVEDFMNQQPVPDGDQEQQIAAQIQQLGQAKDKLQNEVLAWLQSENEETAKLKAILQTKSQKLETQKLKLDEVLLQWENGKIDIKNAQICVEQTRYLVTNSQFQIDLAQLKTEYADLIYQQSDWSKQQAQQAVENAVREVVTAGAKLTIEKLNDKICTILQKQAQCNRADAQKAVEQCILDVKNAQRDLAISKLSQSITTLASQQATLALQNADLKKKELLLQQDQNRLQTQIQDIQANKARTLLKAKQKEVEAAASRLDAAVAKAKAKQNRTVVLGQIKKWYQSQPQSNRDWMIQELERLRYEHQYRTEKASGLVREMLRLLRVGGGDSSPLPLPDQRQFWSLCLEQSLEALNQRWTDIHANVSFLDIRLSKEQIANLFSEKGIYLKIQPSSDPSDQIHEQDHWITKEILPKQHIRVFAIYLMAGDENLMPKAQNNWTRKVSHDPVIPILLPNNQFDTLLCNETNYNRIFEEWETTITSPDQERTDEIRVWQKVIEKFRVIQITGLTGSHQYKKLLGMPLTGTSHFVVKPPKNMQLPHHVRLILAYSYVD